MNVCACAMFLKHSSNLLIFISQDLFSFVPNYSVYYCCSSMCCSIMFNLLSIVAIMTFEPILF
jgi:hypothetical protein